MPRMTPGELVKEVLDLIGGHEVTGFHKKHCGAADGETEYRLTLLIRPEEALSDGAKLLETCNKIERILREAKG